MAKQLVGPVERHVEKAILGVAALLLIGVVARFLVTSPTQLDLGGEIVGPSSIDDHVLAKAQELLDLTRRVRPKGSMPEPLVEEFEQRAKRLSELDVAMVLATGVQTGPTVPIIDPPEVILGDAKLVEVVQLSRPLVAHGRSTFSHSDGSFVPTNWVTVSSIFNRKEQEKRQAAAYGATHQEVLFGPVEAQRRARRSDGSWSDDDWAMVEAAPTEPIPKMPSLHLESIGDEDVLPIEKRSQLRRFYDELAEGMAQKGAIRPMMYEVFNGDMWRFPIITTYRDVLVQDHELLHPLDLETTGNLDNPYGFESMEAEVIDDAELTPAQEITAFFAEGQKFLERAKQSQSENDAIEAYNQFSEAGEHPNATASDKSKAERWKREANNLLADIKRRRRRGKGGSAGGGDAEVERALLPTHQVWIHDAAPSSVESGKTYQYRIRSYLFNQLSGEPSKFSNKNDSLVLMIAGPWSEPSDPIAILPTNYFYVTAADKRKQVASFDLYRWYDGYWVTNKSKLKCGIGEMVRQEQRVEVPNPEDPEETEHPLTTFAPNAMVVGMDFARSFRERNARGGGVKFSKPGFTQSVVLVDDRGELHERFVATDKGNPTRKIVADRVFKPARRGRP